MAELDSLLVTDGSTIRLYVDGEQAGSDVSLPPLDDAEGWAAEDLLILLRRFIEARPQPITRVSQLAERLAPMARLLRDRLADYLALPTPPTPVTEAWQAWRLHVHEDATEEQFSDDLAQVVAYSLAIVALRGGANTNRDNRISLEEARSSLAQHNAVLAAALGPVLKVSGLREALGVEIAAIERLVAAVDYVKVARSRDTRGEPWLWFYEDFLAKYDPQARKQAGVYYTPVDVVQCQVRLSDHILTNIMGLPLSFGDPTVVTLDPATGSGTYPLAVLDRAEQVAVEERGPAGAEQIARSLTERLIAFEILPGPYSVAHLRIGQRLAEMAGELTIPPHVRVYLTDTLDDPEASMPTLGLWGDEAVLAAERAKAAQVKKSQPVTVVIGNPPYARRTRASGGGFVVHPAHGRALFDDVIEGAQKARVIFAAQASLYNDYVYFWRWAMWKAFEQDRERPAVISFITASSWLTGPGFIGLRKLARDLADEIWVLDLGGEGRGAQQDSNVFAIQTPVAVVTLFRTGKTRLEPAIVHYQRIEGDSTAAKLSAISQVLPPQAGDGPWTTLQGEMGDPLVARSGNDQWEQMPALTDVFPWQQPGAMYNRAWPIAPSGAVLRKRWDELLAAPTAEQRAERFVTGKSGRNIHTEVADYMPLSKLPRGASHEPIVRYGYRSFDRQWTFEDPRLAKTESPPLWAARSDQQVFLSSMTTSPLGPGPALTVTTAPPDKHHYRGSFGGKDVIPLFRDAGSLRPNLTVGLLEHLSAVYGHYVAAEDLAAYVYAVLAQPEYEEHFRAELSDPGPRVPLTADGGLFDEAVALGGKLLWLHTFAERYTSEHGTRIPPVPGLGWTVAVQNIPETPADISYDATKRTIQVGTGAVAGVDEAVWGFSVSGFFVVQRWLGARTARGLGRSASTAKTARPLDLIRPQSWEDEWNDELLDLLRVLTLTIRGYSDQAALFHRILAADLISARDLPEPTEAERAVPRT